MEEAIAGATIRTWLCNANGRTSQGVGRAKLLIACAAAEVNDRRHKKPTRCGATSAEVGVARTPNRL
jgi:hypothetical protein